MVLLAVAVVVGVVVPEEEAEVVKGGGCGGLLEDSFRVGGGKGGGRIQVGKGGLVDDCAVVEVVLDGFEGEGIGWGREGEGRRRGGREREVMKGRRAGFGEEGVGSNL